MPNITLIKLTKENKSEFISILEKELDLRFNAEGGIPENYGRQKQWSLINLIESDEIDHYQLIYNDGQFWSGSGGIVRELDGKKVYQAGFRAFSNAGAINMGVGMRSLSHEYNSVEQIARAKELDCDSVIFSFNVHNKRLYEITYRYHLRKVFGPGVFEIYDNPKIFNGVEQWLIVMSLK